MVSASRDATDRHHRRTASLTARRRRVDGSRPNRHNAAAPSARAPIRERSSPSCRRPSVRRAAASATPSPGCCTWWASPASSACPSACAGIFLAERGDGRLGGIVRFTAEVLLGAPSIVIGIVAYGLVVMRMHRFSAIAGAAALAILMVLMLRSTEEDGAPGAAVAARGVAGAGRARLAQAIRETSRYTRNIG